MLAMFISDKLVADMKAIFMGELKELFPALIQQYTANLKKDISISNLISSKLSVVPDTHIKQLLRKQFQIVELLGAVIGFATALLYIFLTWIA